MTDEPQYRSGVQYPIISLNGDFVLPNDLPLSPLDRGFTFGDGIFETMKVVNGTIWYMNRHLDRLSYGASKLGIDVPAKLCEWISHVTQVEPRYSYGLRVIVTRGIAQRQGLAGSDVVQPTVAITTIALPEGQKSLDERVVHAAITDTRRYERGLTVGIKTTNYLESILALRRVIADGYQEAIFLDTQGFVSEASASNIFLWSDGRLITPSNTCGILPGITRAVVLELAERAGIPVAEQKIPASTLYLADEVFLTSSLREIVPVTRLAGHLIGNGTPGPITRQLSAHYDAVTERV